MNRNSHKMTRRDGLAFIGAAAAWPLGALDAWAQSFPAHSLRVVHAGILPGVAFSDQDPWVVTHIRSITDDGKPSSKWGRLWGERYSGPPHIAFGHNARKEPQLHPDATGLDTGCVYGGRLTALVLPAGSEPPAPADSGDALVTYPARRAYENYGRPLS
jgi:hypothetical protein